MLIKRFNCCWWLNIILKKLLSFRWFEPEATLAFRSSRQSVQVLTLLFPDIVYFILFKLKCFKGCFDWTLCQRVYFRCVLLPPNQDV